MNDLSPLGREIHRRYDEWGPVVVMEDDNKRYLSFGTLDEQSCIAKKAPLQLQHEYTRAMASVLLMFPLSALPTRITLLGVGGGSLASVFHHLLPSAQLHAVELRRAVLLVAQQYFGLPRSPQLMLHQADALTYLQHATVNSCDLLICDLYLADGLYDAQLHAEFIQLCAQHITSDGWLVLNLWKEHRQHPSLMTLLATHFRTRLHATTRDGNWILWLNKSTSECHHQDIRQRAKHWQIPLQFNPWASAKGFLKHKS